MKEAKVTNLSVIAAFNLERHERVALLIEAVGGQRRAAEIAEVNADTINNWRKPGARLPIDGLLPICVAAGVSLDWVATGHMVRPDIQARLSGFAEPGPGADPIPGFERLSPLRPELVRQGDKAVERWLPSDIAVSAQWLEREFKLPADAARYATLEDDGMAPRLGRGAMVLLDTRPATPRSGIYLVAGDELLARRLYRMPGGKYELTADADSNWKYATDAKGLPEMHRIVWAGQKL